MIRARKILDGGGIGGVGGGHFQALVGGVARLDDGLERLTLVLDIALGDLDEVGDEVVATSELHIDLGEGVLERIARHDQSVVRRYEDENEPDDQQQYDPAHGKPPKRVSLRRQRCPGDGTSTVFHGNAARRHADRIYMMCRAPQTHDPVMSLYVPSKVHPGCCKHGFWSKNPPCRACTANPHAN